MTNLKNYNGRKGEIVRYFRANPQAAPVDAARMYKESESNVSSYYKLAHGYNWRDTRKSAKQEGHGGIAASANYPSTTNKIIAYFIDHPNAVPAAVAKKFNAALVTAYKMRSMAREKTAKVVHLDVEIPVTPVSVTPSGTPACSTPANAMQVGGSHYKEVGVEPWDAMEAWLTREEFVGFLKGNIIKYMARSRLKGGEEDTKKASHYAAKLNEVVAHTN